MTPMNSVGFFPAQPPRPPASEPLDPIRLVQDRLTYLTAEEARLEGVKADTTARLVGVRTEAKKLRRMLGAAERVRPESLEDEVPVLRPKLSAV